MPRVKRVKKGKENTQEAKQSGERSWTERQTKIYRR